MDYDPERSYGDYGQQTSAQQKEAYAGYDGRVNLGGWEFKKDLTDPVG